MVRGDVADSFHVVGGEPLVRVVIVKVRDPLVWLAAEFSEVMSRRRAGCQRQIDGHACLIKALGHRHRNVVDACDVSQCLERGRLTV